MVTNDNRVRSGRVAVAGALAVIGALCGAAAAGPVATQPPIGDPLPDLTQDELDRFFLGKQQFARDLAVDEGLGPIFNQTACGDCHLNPLGATGTQKVFRAGEETKAGFDPLEEFGGSLFQLEAISDECREDPPPFANVSTDRVTNGMTGYGLVEAIDDCDIIAVRDAQPGAIQGRVHFVAAFEANPVGEPCPPETLRVGRFGWKAQVPTILTFTADASLNEMGFTNRFLTMDNDPNGINPPDLADCDTVADPEDSVAFGNGVDREFIDVVTDFQRFMAGPPQTPQHTYPNPSAASGMGMIGEERFDAAGCAGCHVAEWTTSSDFELEAALQNKVIRPYSDLLLHAMGLNGDGIPQGDALATELKTPPLWGLWQRAELWHDGRFSSGDFDTRVADAIAAHDDGVGLSQGAAAAQAFAALSPSEQQEVLDFLASLGRREFDINRDDAIKINDFASAGIPLPNGGAGSFKACFKGGPYDADDLCAIHDVDMDTDVDLDDLEIFMSVYQGLRQDCNGNGTLDFVDILQGTAADDDDDGILDECQPTCSGDANGDANVGIEEFTGVLGAWGSCPGGLEPCPYDLDGDNKVGINDFLLTLARWGACP